MNWVNHCQSQESNGGIKNDGGRNPRFAPVKFNLKDDGGRKAEFPDFDS